MRNNDVQSIMHLAYALSFGGVTTVLKEIVEKWESPKDIYVFVIKKTDNSVKINSDRVYYNKYNSKFFLLVLFDLARFIKRNKIGIIHVQQYSVLLIYIYILRKIFKLKFKLIFHQHALYRKSQEYNWFQYFIQKNLLENLITQNDRIIAVSNEVKRLLIENINIDISKIIVLHNPIPQKNKNQITKRLINKNPFVVGFMGRFISTKGWKVFLDTVNLFKESNEYEFVIAGDGPDKNIIMNYISIHNINSKVKYIGYVKNSEQFFSLIDCYVSTSFFESFGLTILESQSYGVPVISSDLTSIRELTHEDEDVIFLKDCNKHELAGKIRNLYSNNILRNKLSMNGLENVRRFDPNRYCEMLQNIYIEKDD